jgi:hypothetical protein
LHGDICRRRRDDKTENNVLAKKETKMKDILMDDEGRLPEPLNSVMALAADYSYFPILEAVYELLECEREHIAHCAKCCRKTELLYSGLGQLLRTYRREFRLRVEVVGGGIVQ